MSRLGTFALVAGVVVLALAALVDALVPRDGPEPAGATTTGPADDGAPLLAEAGIDGRLLYTAPDDCRMEAVELPALEPVEAPEWATCAFSLGPGSAVAPEGTVFERSSGLRAEEFEGGVDVFDPAVRRGRRFEAARAPAFRPDGTLTLVRRGAILTLGPCPGRAPLVDRLGRCRSTIMTEEQLTSLAPLSVDPEPLRLAVETLAWLDEWRLVALADAGTVHVLLSIDTREAEPDVEVWFEEDSLRMLEVSPRGRFVSAVIATGQLAIFDDEGIMLGVRGSQVRATAWSPDERWLAVLGGGGVLFVDSRDGATVGPVALAARDLAWE